MNGDNIKKTGRFSLKIYLKNKRKTQLSWLSPSHIAFPILIPISTLVLFLLKPEIHMEILYFFSIAYKPTSGILLR